MTRKEKLDKLMESLNYLNELRELSQIDDTIFFKLNEMFNELYEL